MNLPHDISSIMRRTIKDFVNCVVAHNVVDVVVVVLQSNLNHDYQVDRLNANEEETKKGKNLHFATRYDCSDCNRWSRPRSSIDFKEK